MSSSLAGGLAGDDLRLDDAGEGLGLRQPAAELDALHHAAPVGLGGQVIGVDQRLLHRVGAGQGDGAAAFRAELAGADGHAGEVVQLQHGLGRAEGQEMVLHVRRLAARQDAGEEAGGAGADGQRAGAAQREFGAHQRLAEQAGDALVEAARALHPEGQPRLEMVLQVAADLRQVVHDRHAERPAGAPPGRCRTAAADAVRRWRRPRGSPRAPP